MLDRPDLLRAASQMQVAAADHLSPGGENDPEAWRELTIEGFGHEPAVYEALLPNVGAVGLFDDGWRDQAFAQAERMRALGLLSAVPGEADVLALDQQVG